MILKYPEGDHAVLVKKITIKDQKVTITFMDPAAGSTRSLRIDPITLLDGNLYVFSK